MDRAISMICAVRATFKKSTRDPYCNLTVPVPSPKSATDPCGERRRKIEKEIDPQISSVYTLHPTSWRFSDQTGKTQIQIPSGFRVFEYFL